MQVRFPGPRFLLLCLSLGLAGCGGGMKEGMPTNLAEDPENLKQQKAVDEENMRLMKNPMNVQKK